MTDTETKFWLGFRLTPLIGGPRILKLREQFGSLERAWRAPSLDLGKLLDQRARASLLETRERLDLDQELAELTNDGIALLTRDDPAYPDRLAQIPLPPPLLYVRGQLTPADNLAIAIVGTRRPTRDGREFTARLAAELAEAGLTIVSGLARGIDGVAHQAALDAGGRTIAILGSGLNVIYPPEHRKLAERIAQSGAVISENTPDTPPDARVFPPRNRIIAGISLAVIVVEAPAKSGTLITVDFAADYGRDVFVAPGSPLAAATAGSNRLLRDGARAITCAADVLDDLNLSKKTPKVTQTVLPIDDNERRLLALLAHEPLHIDDLCAALQQPIQEIAALLLTMELNGLVRNTGGHHYLRV